MEEAELRQGSVTLVFGIQNSRMFVVKQQYIIKGNYIFLVEKGTKNQLNRFPAFTNVISEAEIKKKTYQTLIGTFQNKYSIYE